MEAIQAAVEQACIEFQNPATQAQAEKVLVHFRQHHRPALPACRHILEHSASPDARFQAALALKEALLREWGTLSSTERDGLIAWLVQQSVRLADQSGGLASSSLLSLVSTLAVAVKRGWLEQTPERRAALVQELTQLLSPASVSASPSAAYVGLRALDALVTEYNLTSASPLGLPWDYHQRCARDWEDHYLQHVFLSGVSVARHTVESGVAVRGEDRGFTAGAITLLTSCLQWEFKRLGVPMQSSIPTPHVQRRQGESSAPSTAQSITPGQPWSQLLLDPHTLQWLVTLLHQLRAGYGPLTQENAQGWHMSAPLASLPPPQRTSVVHTAVRGRSLLLALCALSGDVFPRDDTQGTVRHQYLCTLLQAIVPMCWPLEAALSAARTQGFEASELLDACRCLSALSSVHRAGPLQAAGSQVLGVSGPVPGASSPGFLGVLECVTLTLVRSGGVSASGVPTSDESDDKYWLQECVDVLIEAWSSLLVSDSYSVRNDPSALCPAAVTGSASVFSAVVDAALADAARGAHEDVDDAAESAESAGLEDWMARAANLARHAPTHTFSHLANAMTTAQNSVAAASNSGGDPDLALEQLSWLVRLSAHCLADSGAGETPLLPLPLSQAIERGVPGVAESVMQLCQALLQLPALVLVPQARPLMSPRLMECAVWSLSRWCDTYLFPEEDLPPPLALAYGGPRHPPANTQHTPTPGPQDPSVSNGVHPPPGASDSEGAGGLPVLDMSVQVANTCLTSYPGEMELHKQVVCVLLPVLVRRKPLSERLMSLPAWQTLVQATAGHASVLQQGLGQKLHRALMQSLCLAANGVSRTSVAASYVTQLLQRTVEEVVALSSRRDLASVAVRADVIVNTCCLLEALRGAMRATLSRTQPALFALITRLLQPLLTLQLAFKAHTQAVALVLKLASDTVEAHISYLKASEVDVLLRWVLTLLQQYASINTWAARLHASRSQKDSDLAEAARDLRALLRLLGHVTQRDITHTDTGDTHDSEGRLAAATAANAHSLQSSLDTAQVVLTGLNILLPLMTSDILKFPKLPRLYFNLLAYMMENYPEQVCALAPGPFSMLMSSLEFGLSDNTTDSVVLQSALEGLTGLARYQQHCRSVGLPGLLAHTVNGRTASSTFLELLFKRLLLGDWSQDMVELSADALQPFLLVESQTYADLAQQLIAAHTHDQSVSQRIASSLGRLIQSDQTAMQQGQGATPAAARHMRRAFREALCDVVTDVRSLIHVR